MCGGRRVGKVLLDVMFVDCLLPILYPLRFLFFYLFIDPVRPAQIMAMYTTVRFPRTCSVKADAGAERCETSEWL